MCGIAALVGPGSTPGPLRLMTALQGHRGPDASAIWFDPAAPAGLGHARLAILDRSDAAAQPMTDPSGRWTIAFNGEIYNYRELRDALPGHAVRGTGDTAVLLAAWATWGPACLDRLLGMFAFVVWDAATRTLHAVRDRFGVKPLYYRLDGAGRLHVASELTPLLAIAPGCAPDPVTWASYLVHGVHDHGARTFWTGISALPPGHHLVWRDGVVRTTCWYDLVDQRLDEPDLRDDGTVEEELHALLADAVRLRFRADVPVGIALSGGLDSSLLLALVHEVRGADGSVAAFTFTTGDERYDEVGWVRSMLAATPHPLVECRLDAADVPALHDAVQAVQREPFGGIPTLAYARVFEEARARGVLVVLDGQGMDEQWAGYDYHRTPGTAGTVQGVGGSALRPGVLLPEFRAAAEAPAPVPLRDPLQRLLVRDLTRTKLVRALRFNDRVSMRAGVELREPFLDHRLVEFALRQPAVRKLRDGESKWLVRRLARRIVPESVVTAPKRPLQTPQREWLAGPLAEWAAGRLDALLGGPLACWFDAAAVRGAWQRFRGGETASAYHIWQWIAAGSATDVPVPTRPPRGDDAAWPTPRDQGAGRPVAGGTA